MFITFIKVIDSISIYPFKCNWRNFTQHLNCWSHRLNEPIISNENRWNKCCCFNLILLSLRQRSQECPVLMWNSYVLRSLALRNLYSSTNWRDSISLTRELFTSSINMSFVNICAVYTTIPYTWKQETIILWYGQWDILFYCLFFLFSFFLSIHFFVALSIRDEIQLINFSFMHFGVSFCTLFAIWCTKFS